MFRTLPLLFCLPFLVTACDRSESVGSESVSSMTSGPTLVRDVAPVLYKHCVTCHRPGGSGPFSFLDEAVVRKRSQLIAEVVASGEMPPWLPAEGEIKLALARRLSAADREVLQVWAAAGAPRGEGAMPEAPVFHDGWHLGPPDLVVTSAVPYVVPADGPDVFRNLVIPIPVDRPRWVRAVELRPGSPRVVHHAILKVDRSGSARALAAADRAPGFGGMDMGGARSPAGHFIGWTPGKDTDPGDPDTAWELMPGDDVVLQLHCPPSGRPEWLRPEIGFYFSDRAPKRSPYGILLSSADIHLPAGSTNVVVRDEYVLPVAVALHGLYPHAHFLGDDLKALAHLPDGSRRTLLHIPDWDFNWQDDYRLAEPLPLPAGTRLEMVFGYDNSDANPQNPNRPPEAVTFGPDSTDEMAALLIQVVVDSKADHRALQDAMLRRRLVKDPLDWSAWNSLGELVVQQDEARAERCFRRALEIREAYATPHYHLGLIEQKRGRSGVAMTHFRRAVELRPDYASALGNLGALEFSAGQADAAIGHFRAALAVNPRLAVVHSNLGSALCARGEYDEGIGHLKACLDLLPAYLQAHVNLVLAFQKAGRPEAARDAASSALAVAQAQQAPAAIVERLRAAFDGR